MNYPKLNFVFEDETAVHFPEDLTRSSNRQIQSLYGKIQEWSEVISRELERRKLLNNSTQAEACEDDEYVQRLQKTAQDLQLLERLDDRSARHVNIAIQTLQTPQRNKGFVTYQNFLNDVLRLSGPGSVLICAVALGKQRTVNMTKETRVRVLKTIRETHTQLSSPALESLATRYRIPQKENGPHTSLSGADTNCEDAGTTNRELHKRARESSSGAAETPRARRPSLPQVNEDNGNANREQSPEADRSSVQRQIEYRYSSAPSDSLHCLGELLCKAVQGSQQWSWERQLSPFGSTDCVNALAPKNRSHDISITLRVGYKPGMQLVDKLQLEPM